MIIKKVFKLTLSLFILALAGLLGLQVYVHFSTKAQIYSDSIQVPESDYIMVLGCGVLENRPTPMLQNRLDAGLELYQRNKGAKIILSGHKDGDYYDEVSVMKNYLLEKGVPEEDLIEDKAGTNTYYSIRNFDRYQDESLIVVTQKKHLERALYLANMLDQKEVYGYEAMECDSKSYTMYMNVREVFARVKAVMDVCGLHIE